jgi:hypothetical protein
MAAGGGVDWPNVIVGSIFQTKTLALVGIFGDFCLKMPVKARVSMEEFLFTLSFPRRRESKFHKLLIRQKLDSRLRGHDEF